MEATHRQEVSYYSHVPDGIDGADFDIQTFQPRPGTLLVCFPEPPDATEGGIIIPDRAKLPQDIGQVVGVPMSKDAHALGDLAYPECPFELGDWVVVRHLAGEMVNLVPDRDLRFIQYSDDASSEILGTIKRKKSKNLLDI